MIRQFLFAIAAIGLSASEAWGQEPPAARIVSLRANAFAQVEGSQEAPAEVNQRINGGDQLRTDDYGRISMLLPNHMLLKMAESTSFLYRGIDHAGNAGRLRAGKVWLRGQHRASPFNIQTPTATAAIRGTEWYMEVAPDGTTKVGVVEGTVLVENDLGRVELAARELALIEPGKAPVKLAYLTPENAVNWTLNYFGLFDEEDFARGGPALEPVLRQVVDSYYRGNLAAGSKALAQASQHESTAAWQAAAGFLAMVGGKGDLARKYFERASRLDRTWALPAAHLSLIALVEGRGEDALFQAKDAASRSEKSAIARIASAYALKGAALSPEEAYGEAQKAAELSPHFDPAIVIAARLALELERFAEAENYLSRLPDDSPLAAEKNTLAGYLALRGKKDEKALALFEQALAASPDSPDALIGRGIALFKRNRSQEAVDSLIRATLVAPQVADYQSYLAKAYFELGRNRDGLGALARAERLDRKDPTPHLYRALYEQAQYQPGRSYLSLVEARKRNENRAVFRSRYLLDQDTSVLTSNLAQVYNELGFDHSATQEAARALELDPTNQAAHRRLFFALTFDPRGYAQASASERLLNNLFMPPTKNGVVLDENVLTPYTQTFDRAGVDPILRGGYVHSDVEAGNSDMAFGNAILAAELPQPIAFSVDFATSYSNTESTQTAAASGGGPELMRDRDDDDLLLTYRAFAKAQPSRTLGLFIEGRAQDEDGEGDFTQTGGNGGQMPGVQQPTVMSGSDDSDFENYDFDTGVHLAPTPSIDALLHFSFHDDKTDTRTRVAAIDRPLPRDEVEGSRDQEFWIAQGAFWKRTGGHFIQVGGRYYDQAMTAATRSLGGMERTEFDSGNDVDLQSYFILDQYSGIDDVVVTAALNADYGHYDYDAGGSNEIRHFGPSLGVSWQGSENLYLRGAIINNLAGDRSERLQQTLIAGFPFQRLTLIEPYTDEQLFNLDYETYSLGLDYYLPEQLVFIGAEAEYDRQESAFLVSEDSDETADVSNDAVRGRFYVESLLSSQTSTTFVYRFDHFNFPVDTDRHGVDVSLNYFFSWGMGLKLAAGVITFDEEGSSPADDTVFIFTPALEGYPLQRRMRLNLAAPFDSDGNYSARLNFILYL